MMCRFEAGGRCCRSRCKENLLPIPDKKLCNVPFCVKMEWVKRTAREFSLPVRGVFSMILARRARLWMHRDA